MEAQNTPVKATIFLESIRSMYKENWNVDLANKNIKLI